MALYFIPKYQMPNEKFPVLSQEDIVSLNTLSSLSEQMKQLSSLLEISPEEYDQRRSACAEVLQLLRKFYPDCLLLMFGSSVNSFGVKGCDLDLLFLPFPSYCNLDFSTESDKSPTPDPSSILTGEVSRNILAKFNEFSHLKFIRTILRREKIKKVNFIPSPKCPNLKVHLNNSKIICDISASNRLVVFNSELLQFFEKIDVRVKPLVVCLIYWARSLGFIKRSFFSSYAFTLLIIFFLQTTNPPVLPSVEHLIEISGFSRKTAGWQTAFVTDVKAVPETKNTETVGELLLHFFDYYFHFDFLQYVVCPHSGKALPLNEIMNSEDERMTGFEITSLNIQDVFILSRNVCKIEKLAIFKLALLTACEMLKDDKKIKFYMLFDPNEYQSVLDTHYFKFMSGRPKICFINFDYDCMKKFENLHSWYDKASEAVYEVLQYGLLIECEITDKMYSKKKNGKISTHSENNDIERDGISNAPQLLQSNFNDKSSTPYDLQLLLSIQCVLYSRTWIGRKNVEVTMLDTQDELEAFADSALSSEYCISKSLVKKKPLLSSPVPVLCFKCDCYKHVSPEIADMIVMLKPLTISREFYQVSAFLASFIPKTVKKKLTAN